MTDEDIKRLVKEAVKEALSDGCPVRSCPITAEAGKEIGHFFGMIKDVGGGNMSKGVEELRGALRETKNFRDFWNNVTLWVSRSIIVTIIGAIFALLFFGIKFFIEQQ